MLFNFSRCSEISLVKLHPNSGLAITLSAFGRNPHHRTVDLDFFRFVHLGE